MMRAMLNIVFASALVYGAHPTVFVTPQAVARAKKNIGRYAWARESANTVQAAADRWLAREDSWLRGVMPKPGAAYAYGLAGCPICGAGWGAWGLEGGSFDNQGHITCKRGHMLPDLEHPDPGTGYIAPDGRIHFFIGSYNAFVIETLTFDALENLVYAYTLTGDERYAAKAAVILDAIAAIYPGSHKGCWDYPSNPPSGRLDRPWYQASRVLVHYVDHYDQLANSKALDAPSITPGLTRRKNIEENLLRDGGEYCYRLSKAGRLHNGEADYLRGALAVGLVLGIPEYVDWAVNGPFGIKTLLENDIDRDGAYYEVTPMYSEHTRELYFTFTEPLLNAGVLNLYNHPKVRSFFSPHNLVMNGAGHMPRYGDAPPDFVKRPAPARPFDRADFDFLEKLYARTSDAATGGLLAWLANDKLDQLRSGPIVDRRVQAGMSIYREPGEVRGGNFTEKMWMLFNAGDEKVPSSSITPDWQRRLTQSDFIGQKGLGILRAGNQAVMMRFGPSLNHGHFDDLNINYIARGYELTYDLGYGHTAATQTQYGWAKQTASHNLVVVDERPQQEGGLTGGSLHLFASSPSVQVMEASSEASYSKQNVREYRRTIALIGTGDDAYLLDIFRVKGGKQHDWTFHAPTPNAVFTGVTLGSEEPGSLAGPLISWSDKQLADGDLAGHPNAPSWIAPPGNGYGFLAHPQRTPAPGSWSADWEIDPTAHVRVTMPATARTEVLTAVANGLYPNYPKARYVMARRRGEQLESDFVAVIEPHGGTPHIRSVERLAVNGAIAVKIAHDDGREDFVYSALDDSPRQVKDLLVGARFALARVRNGKLESLTMSGGNQFAGFGRTLNRNDDRLAGAVESIDMATNTFLTAAQLPLGNALKDAVIVFNNPAYTHSTAYRIVSVERAANNRRRVRVHATFKLGIGDVDSVTGPAAFTSMIPHEYAFSDKGNGERGFFRGKRIVTSSGASTRVKAVRPGLPMKLTVESTTGFKTGDRFEYADVQKADAFEILFTYSTEGVQNQ
jgi:hypothetical protein